MDYFSTMDKCRGKENVNNSSLSNDDKSSYTAPQNKTINAFDVLMNKVSLERVSSKRRRLSSSCYQQVMDSNGSETISGISTGANSQSRFAECPICLKRIPLATVDFHADQCLDQTTWDLSQVSTAGAKDNNSARMEKSITVNSRTPLLKTNALQHLMDQSKLMSRPPLKQRFHLHSDLTVTWDNGSQDGDENIMEAEAATSPDKQNNPIVQWSAIIMLDTSHGSPQEEEERLIELMLSSSLPSSSTAPKSFMSKLSKLSIPVLKSMIQKSIRRQRPQQATMLAMELSDKSWSDLLRRIPIIMLEDAALHPDLPLLVWLMVADSKNFVVSSTIADRVMSIVFELAACPWRDKAAVQNDKNMELSINKDTALRGLGLQNQTIIKSMLLRAKYGGMMCDVIMMKNFASLWMCRFQNDLKENHHSFCHGVMVQDNKGILSSTSFQTSILEGKHIIPWSSLPLVLYRQFRKEYEQYARNSGTIAEEEGRLLRWDDLCAEGIDFHCSNVLDIVLQDHKATLLSLLDHHEKGVHTKPDEELLRSICQKAMWIHSSGVNIKQFMSQDDLEERNQQASFSNRVLLSSLWNFMKPHIDQFCRQYLLLRISPPSKSMFH